MLRELFVVPRFEPGVGHSHMRDKRLNRCTVFPALKYTIAWPLIVFIMNSWINFSELCLVQMSSLKALASITLGIGVLIVRIQSKLWECPDLIMFTCNP